VATTAWHRDFAARAGALGYELIWSLSFELFDQHCPEDWKQRAVDGAPGLTGWSPPSALLSPRTGRRWRICTRSGARSWRSGPKRASRRASRSASPGGGRCRTGGPCLYDTAAVAAFAPVPIASVRASLDAAQRDTLDRAGACLAAATAALCAHAKAVAPGCVTHLLAYLPTVLDPLAPELKRANLPVGWASPAFDVLQLEVTTGARRVTRRRPRAASRRRRRGSAIRSSASTTWRGSCCGPRTRRSGGRSWRGPRSRGRGAWRGPSSGRCRR
jgi:hypothetical protein